MSRFAALLISPLAQQYTLQGDLSNYDGARLRALVVGVTTSTRRTLNFAL